MNNKFVNVLFVIFGFLANLLLARSPEWNIVAVLGALFAGIGLSNLTYFLIPNNGTKADWIIPLALLVIFGALVALLRTNAFFGLSGDSLNLVQTITIILTIAPLSRLYAYVRHFIP